MQREQYTEGGSCPFYGELRGLYQSEQEEKLMGEEQEGYWGGQCGSL